MKPNEQRLWTVENLAEYLQVKPSVIKYWLYNTDIPYIKLGRIIRFERKDIEEWIDERKTFNNIKLL